jgi:MFS family permease
VLAAFRRPGFAVLWFSGLLSSIGFGISQVSLSWLVLSRTDSDALVGLVFALRMAPLVIIGPLSGALSDRIGRRRLLIAANGGAALLFVIVVALGFSGHGDIVWILALVTALGALGAVALACSGAFAYDLAGTGLAANAIAHSQLAGRLGAVVGGLAGGAIVALVAIEGSLIVLAAIYALAGLLLLLVSEARPTIATAGATLDDVRAGIALVRRNRPVLVLIVVAIAAETFGFSSDATLPSFARDVLGVDSSGLGAMFSASRVGGFIGLFAIAAFPSAGRSGRMLVLSLLGFGAALVGFGLSTSYSLSLFMLALSGAAAASVDALGQTLLQDAVEDGSRGRAMGLWVLSVGSAPLGFLEIGLLASVLGVQTAQVLNGLAAGVIAGVVLLPSLTRPRRAP